MVEIPGINIDLNVKRPEKLANFGITHTVIVYMYAYPYQCERM